MRSIIYSSLMLLVISGCNSINDNPEGGPCTYETTIYPASVIAIEKKDSVEADVIFSVEDNKGKIYRDSVSLYMESNQWLTIAEIEKNKIAIGKRYQYRIRKILTGNCNPRIEGITLDKFD